MKKITPVILFFALSTMIYGQGAGIGYQLDIGGSGYSQPGAVYDQSFFTSTHNLFFRVHNRSGNNALQFMMGYRMDTISFTNHSQFIGPDGISIMQYNTSAYLKRDALKFSVIDQIQIGRPGRVVLALNAGLFCEQTLFASRFGNNDDRSYKLKDELNFSGLGGILGVEFRILCFTLGYKYEQLFGDILDHDYILSQDISIDNSSELRGLVLNPPMHYVTLGINLDFYHKPHRD